MWRHAVRTVVSMVLLLNIGAPVSAQTRKELTRERPGVLVPLYVTFVALQALDAHSTVTAV